MNKSYKHEMFYEILILNMHLINDFKEWKLIYKLTDFYFIFLYIYIQQSCKGIFNYLIWNIILNQYLLFKFVEFRI